MTQVLSNTTTNLLPQVLSVNAYDESQSIQVESNILDPNSFNWVQSHGGVARFSLPKKGTVLDSNSSLVYKAQWQGYDAGVARRQLSFQRFCGGLSVLKNARLYVNGRLITETRELGQLLALKNNFLPPEYKTDVFDLLTMSDNRYWLSQSNGGYLHLYPAIANASPYSKTLKASSSINAEVCVPLSLIFGILKDVQLPVSMMSGDVMIEIDFEGSTENVLVKGDFSPAKIRCVATVASAGPPAVVAGGIDVAQFQVLDGGCGFADADALVFTRLACYGKPAVPPLPGAGVVAVLQNVLADGVIPANGIDVQTPGVGYEAGEVVKVSILNSASQAYYKARDNFAVFQPRLMLDYITYDDQTKMLLQEQILGQGISFVFREISLIRKNLPSILPNTVQTEDLEIGFAGRQVMKVYAQKLSQGYQNEFMKNFRSDKLAGETFNLIVNNKKLYDRDVVLDAEAYNHLSQCSPHPFNCLPGAYELQGKLSLDLNNLLDTEVSNGSTNFTFNGLQHQIQGRQKYLGFNLSKIKNGVDSPMNSVRVGSSPMILRLTRQSNYLLENGNAVSGDQETMDAVNLNIWIEHVKQCVLKNGVVQINNF